MKLAVVTITCRPNPRLAEAGRCLAASLARAKDVELCWFIIDERVRPAHSLIAGNASIDELTEIYAPLGSRFDVRSGPPISSAARNAAERLPAHNSARNAGLIEAARWGADYVMLLNDVNMVTADWVQVAKDCNDQGLGWSCKLHILHDLAVPANGFLRHHDHHDRLRPIRATQAPRASFGAPMAAFVAIGGFDMAYDGQKHGNDIEAAVRMSRGGLQWVTTERAFSVQLRRTKQDSDITTSRGAITGANNKRRLQKLLGDKTRTEPERGVDLVRESPEFAKAWGIAPAGPQGDGSAPAPKPARGANLRVVGNGSAGAKDAGTARPADDAEKVDEVDISSDEAMQKAGVFQGLTEAESDLADEFDTGGVD